MRMETADKPDGESSQERELEAQLEHNVARLYELAHETVAEFESVKLLHLSDGIWGLDLSGHSNAELMVSALRTAWEHDYSSDGWGMIPVASPNSSYEPSVRDVYKAKGLVPAVCVGFVSPKAIHRMMITALSLPVRAFTGSILTAHSDFDEALETVRQGMLSSRN
jgi:hypothetical protein